MTGNKYPWVRLVIFTGLIIYGTIIAVTAKPTITWFDIALPLLTLMGIIYFTQARRG